MKNLILGMVATVLGFVILSCGKKNSSTEGKIAEERHLAITHNRKLTDADLVKINRVCVEDSLSQLWSQVYTSLQIETYETQATQYLTGKGLDHVLLTAGVGKKIYEKAQYQDFGGIDDWVEFSVDDGQSFSVGFMKFYIKGKLPRLHYTAPTDHEYDKYGQKLPPEKIPAIEISNIWIWLPKTHSKAVPLYNYSTGQQSNLSFDTVRYVECLKKGIEGA